MCVCVRERERERERVEICCVLLPQAPTVETMIISIPARSLKASTAKKNELPEKMPSLQWLFELALFQRATVAIKLRQLLLNFRLDISATSRNRPEPI